MNMYCFVGDLLGFKSIIENLDVAGQSERVDEWIALAKDATEKFDIPHFQLVSDTIFASSESSEAGLRKIIGLAKFLLESGIEKNLPIRGGVAYCDVCWDKEVTYGKGVTDAYKLESDGNWIGVACQSSLPHLDACWAWDKLICYPTPSKAGPVALRPAVSWEVPHREYFTKNILMRGLSKQGEQLPWSWYEKVQNTLLFKMYKSLVPKLDVKAEARNFYGNFPIDVIDETLFPTGLSS